MATKTITRKLQPAAPVDNASIVKWEDKQGTEIALNVPLIRQLFQGSNALTDADCLAFIHQARSRRANPWMGDIFVIKYEPNRPASIQTGYHFFMRVAQENPRYAGFDVWCVNKEGKRIADGLEAEEDARGNVVAAVCEIYIRGLDRPIKFVATMREFDKHQALWKTMRTNQIKKCALGNAHRHADPNLAGLYLPEEVGQGYVDSEVAVPALPLVEGTVEAPEAPVAAETPPATPEPVSEAPAPAEASSPPKQKGLNEAQNRLMSELLDRMAAAGCAPETLPDFSQWETEQIRSWYEDSKKLLDQHERAAMGGEEGC